MRALLPGSNVSSSRLREDMPRHENYHVRARTRAHTLSRSQPLFVSGQKYMRMYHWMYVQVFQRFPAIYLRGFSVDTRAIAHPPARLRLFVPQSMYTLGLRITRYLTVRYESVHILMYDKCFFHVLSLTV